MSKTKSTVDCECGAMMVRNGWLVTKAGRSQRYHCSQCGLNIHGETIPHGKKR